MQGGSRDEGPATRASLLLKIRDFRDRKSWEEFIEIYGPLVLRQLRAMGFAEQEAVVLANEVLELVMLKIGDFDYDPKRGRFRGWLATVARNYANTWRRREQRAPAAAGGSGPMEALTQTPDDDRGLERLAEADEERWERRLLEVAIQRVRPRVKPTTWQSFELRLFGHREPDEIAECLGIGVGSVYTNISRVAAMLRKVIEDLRESERC